MFRSGLRLWLGFGCAVPADTSDRRKDYRRIARVCARDVGNRLSCQMCQD
jgi:hypothetical protein